MFNWINFRADRIKGLEDNSNAITRERDTCQKDKGALDQEKAKLVKEVADSKSTNENSKTQINELQNEIVSNLLFVYTNNFPIIKYIIE